VITAVQQGGRGNQTREKEELLTNLRPRGPFRRIKQQIAKPKHFQSGPVRRVRKTNMHGAVSGLYNREGGLVEKVQAYIKEVPARKKK